MEVLQEQILAVLGTILTIVGGYLTKQLKDYLDKKGISKELENKRVYAEIAVKAVQQMYQEADGKKKLSEAKKQLVSMLDNKGIHITDTELDMLVEAAVKGMKQGAK